ncbi:methyl-accepting chemotaxis protein [Thiorhodococcus fuscus]|uniref:Methyl-accepting chemotaxis protein n=1 Tax=Thiorhodococcus fuscus TaxID=527200 RepID=A0ABW4YCQ7_9GAMM
MRIRTSVTLAAISVTLVVAALLILVSHLNDQRLQSRVAEEMADAKQLIWRQVRERLFTHMAMGAKSFEDDFYLRQAIKQKDAAALKEAVASLENLVGGQGYFERFHLFDTENAVLCCGDPARISQDAIALAAKTADDGERHRGIGRDADGTPIALLSAPLNVRHAQIGTLVLEQPIAPLLQRVKNWDETESALIGLDGARLGDTNAQLFDQLKGDALSRLGEKGRRTANLDQGVFNAIRIDVQGIDGNPVARLVSLSDFSAGYAAQSRFETIAYSSIALTLILATLALYWYMRRATRPLDQAIGMVSKLADGDLNVAFASNRHDEVGELMRAMQTMVERIRDIVTHLREASGDLQDSASHMAQRAETSKIQFDRHKAETHHVNAAVSLLASSAQDVANHTTHAVGTTADAHQRIVDSRQILEETSALIDTLATEIDQAAEVVIGLADQSNAVGSVLEVIRAIASQTNLLALNASIEAARAGEHGRGFAVVADEVRQLAMRTQHSIQDIESLIASLQNRSTDAVGVIHANRDRAKQSLDRYGQAMGNLDAFGESINSLTEMTRRIADAAEEQSRMADEIARAIDQISQLAAENSGAADSGFAQSAQLQQLSSRLSEHVAAFRIH